MKNPFDARAPSFDADAIHATIQRALASAGLDTTAGAQNAFSVTGVPEPEEWLLIALAVAMLIGYGYKTRMIRTSSVLGR